MKAFSANGVVKYGDPDQKITISLTTLGSRALIGVHNYGNAIARDELGNLFESFQRASTGANKPGWGLGLAAVKGIVESHGGLVRVLSNEEEGTIFTLELPIRINPSTSSGSDELERESDSQRRMQLHGVRSKERKSREMRGGR